jgi:hypothetical protein
MKKLFLQFSVLCMLMPLMAPTCGRSDEFDPSTGLTIELTVTKESRNTNPTKATDPPYSKTFEVKLGDEFKAQSKIDPSKLTTMFVTDFTVEFDKANCANLETYSIVVNFPDIGSETNSDCNSALDFASSSTPFGKKVLANNFAQAIKDNKPISVTFTMKAKKDIPSAGASIVIQTKATYKP